MSTSRRDWLRGAITGVAGLTVSACTKLSQSPKVNHALDAAETLTRRVQGGLLGRTALAQEFPANAISRDFRANGSTNPDSDEYRQHVTDGFKDWRIEIGGLVEHPLSLSMADLRAAASRTQITRHDCVEGWSCIAKWKGAVLAPLLEQARLKPKARYLVLYCADTLELTLDGTGDYYEVIRLDDAFHPQTILAYEMNDAALPVANGAPVRMRLERALGYKMAKYVTRIDAIDSFAKLGLGKGGYWEDRGYQWYAGI